MWTTFLLSEFIVFGINSGPQESWMKKPHAPLIDRTHFRFSRKKYINSVKQYYSLGLSAFDLQLMLFFSDNSVDEAIYSSSVSKSPWVKGRKQNNFGTQYLWTYVEHNTHLYAFQIIHKIILLCHMENTWCTCIRPLSIAYGLISSTFINLFFLHRHIDICILYWPPHLCCTIRFGTSLFSVPSAPVFVSFLCHLPFFLCLNP